ncbi:MAG: hypothetical protein EOQ93_29345 [Mesorhizobium sp.]|nr:MAG: hypothetical protein EOQ93_29345 [Mesorhizobium sp.]
MLYKTELVATRDGKGQIGMAMWLDGNVWRVVGETRTYRTYPAAVRARTAADGLCRAHWGRLPFAQRIGQGYSIRHD